MNILLVKFVSYMLQYISEFQPHFCALVWSFSISGIKTVVVPLVSPELELPINRPRHSPARPDRSRVQDGLRLVLTAEVKSR